MQGGVMNLVKVDVTVVLAKLIKNAAALGFWLQQNSS
jgi:hypothetical protein